MGHRTKQRIHNRRIWNGQKALKNVQNLQLSGKSKLKRPWNSNFTPIKQLRSMAQVKAYVDKYMERQEHSSIAGGIAHWCNHSEHHDRGSSENQKQENLKTQLYTILGVIFPKDAQPGHRGTYSTTVIAALFVTDRNWKQSRCPITEEWIQKMWFINTMDYYVAMCNQDIMSFEGTWMKLELGPKRHA